LHHLRHHLRIPLLQRAHIDRGEGIPTESLRTRRRNHAKNQGQNSNRG
jgi:hypothetical protein